MKFFAFTIGAFALMLSATTIAAQGLRSLEAGSTVATILGKSTHFAKIVTRACSTPTNAAVDNIPGYTQAQLDQDLASEGEKESKTKELFCNYGPKVISVLEKAQASAECQGEDDQDIIVFQIKVQELGMSLIGCSSGDGSSIGTIIGIIIIVVAVLGIAYCCFRRNKAKSSTSMQTHIEGP